MTPVFGHGALRLYLLSLLAESPQHGYELMQALEHRFGGTYSPSAGTIYPRLAKLEEEGLVTKSVDGRRTTYTITDAGRAELREREGELHTLESEITDSVRRMASDVRASVRSAMQGLRADLASAERDARSAAKRAGAASAPRADVPGGHDASARHDGFSQHGEDGGDAWAMPAAPAEGRADASHTAQKAAARMAIHDVDLALSDFRQEVREATRQQRGGHMTTERAATVRRELEAALLRIKSVLGS